MAHAAVPTHTFIYWNGPSGSDDNEQQITLVDRAIARRHFGIVLTPSAPFALDTVIESALTHEIPVVILGSAIDLPPNRLLSFVLNDDQRSGELAAARVHQLLGAKGEVALAGDDAMWPSSRICARAFEAALHRDAPEIRIVGRLSGDYTPGTAETALERVIQEHPHLDAIYSLRIGITHGAVSALRDMHREGKVVLIGNDQSLDLLFLLRQGTIDSLVVEDMRAMGEQAIGNILALRHGDSVQPVNYHEPVLVTRDNIDTEAVQERLRMDWRPQP